MSGSFAHALVRAQATLQLEAPCAQVCMCMCMCMCVCLTALIPSHSHAAILPKPMIGGSVRVKPKSCPLWCGVVWIIVWCPVL